MKKFIVIGSVIGVGYIVFKKTKEAFLTQDICMTQDAGDTNLDNPTVAKFVKMTNRVIQKLPYSDFCAISGCKFEVHATREEKLDSEMREHVQTKHPFA